MKSQGLLTVMVVAGGSGGHVFPAVAFAEEFLERYGERGRLIFVTTSGKAFFEAVPGNLKPVVCPARRSLSGLWRLFASAWGLVARHRPSVIVAFGGYFCAPFVLVARLRGSRVVLHEQNVVPGRANRLLSFWAHRVAVTFEASRRYLRCGRGRIFLARYPLRRCMRPRERSEALGYFGFSEDFFTLLVVGGSQGAHRLNEALTVSVAAHPERARWQVIHIAGAADAASVEAAYAAAGVRHKVFSFLKEMSWAYAAADLAVSRSGAGCLQEILFFGLPSILIPYPFAGGHQGHNARAVAETGAAVMVEETMLSVSFLTNLLALFFQDTIRRKTMSRLARGLHEASANMSLVDVVMS